MKRSKKILLITLAIIILVFLLITLEKQAIKEKVIDLILTYNYPAIIITTYISDILFQPLGPDIPIFIASLILNPTLVFLSASIATILASLTSYYLGKKFGLPGFKRITRKKYKKYNKLYNEYGLYGLFLSAISPIPYVPFCWISGIFKIKLRKFILIGIIPRIIRFLVIILIATTLN